MEGVQETQQNLTAADAVAQFDTRLLPQAPAEQQQQQQAPPQQQQEAPPVVPQQQEAPSAQQQQQQQPSAPAVTEEARAICSLAKDLLSKTPDIPGYSILMAGLEAGNSATATALLRDLVARPTKTVRTEDPTVGVAASRGPVPPAGFAPGRALQPVQQQQQAQPQQQRLQPLGPTMPQGVVVLASANRPRQTEVDRLRSKAPMIFSEWNPHSRNNIGLQEGRVNRIVSEGMYFAQSEGATTGYVASASDVSKAIKQVPQGKVAFVYQSLVDGDMPTDVTELTWRNIDAFAAETPEGAREYEIQVIGRARNDAGKRISE
jgi:hypothetical protein